MRSSMHPFFLYGCYCWKRIECQQFACSSFSLHLSFVATLIFLQRNVGCYMSKFPTNLKSVEYIPQIAVLLRARKTAHASNV